MTSYLQRVARRGGECDNWPQLCLLIVWTGTYLLGEILHTCRLEGGLLGISLFLGACCYETEKHREKVGSGCRLLALLVTASILPLPTQLQHLRSRPLDDGTRAGFISVNSWQAQYDSGPVSAEIYKAELRRLESSEAADRGLASSEAADRGHSSGEPHDRDPCAGHGDIVWPET